MAEPILRPPVKRSNRSHRQGDPHLLAPEATPEAKFGQRVTVKPNGCWAYDDDLTRYHSFYVKFGINVPAHRFAYETLVRPVSGDYHLHHTCENPGCVNPAHLTPLTPAEHRKQHAALARKRKAGN